MIVTVGNDKITLKGAASLSSVNIKGDYILVNDKTKSPVTIASSIKTADASARTKAVKITGNKLANSIAGGKGNDSLVGGDGADKLSGNAGNDKLYGGAGNDFLNGGKGDDSLRGGSGKDTFIYSSGDGNDVIFGFGNNDLLKITGTFSASYDEDNDEIYFKVGTTSKAITLRNFDTETFNVNGSTYKISGTKLAKKQIHYDKKIIPSKFSPGFYFARINFAEKNPSVLVTCGRSVFISISLKFSCDAKKFSTTDSFSRRVIVHVL